MYCRFLLAIAPTRMLQLTAAVCVPGLGAPRDGVDDVHTARNNGQRKWRKSVRLLLTTVNAFVRSVCTTLVRGWLSLRQTCATSAINDTASQAITYLARSSISERLRQTVRQKRSASFQWGSQLP